MNKNWIFIVVAAFFEVGWVIGLKHADNVLEWGGTLIAIIISFYLMIMAGRDLAVGTVYSVFVGLGTAGNVVADIILFNAPVMYAKLALIGLLLSGIVNLKVLSNQKKKEVL
jgi:paired small multidrug resistance pump